MTGTENFDFFKGNGCKKSNWWLRSPNVGTLNNPRGVGTVDVEQQSNTNSLAPDCVTARLK